MAMALLHDQADIVQEKSKFIAETHVWFLAKSALHTVVCVALNSGLYHML